MSGFTPVAVAALYSSTTPAMEPWSVTETAGISSCAARSTSCRMRHAPSRMEYSEWQWRWTNGALTSPAIVRAGGDGLRPRPRHVRHPRSSPRRGGSNALPCLRGDRRDRLRRRGRLGGRGAAEGAAEREHDEPDAREQQGDADDDAEEGELLGHVGDVQRRGERGLLDPDLARRVRDR